MFEKTVSFLAPKEYLDSNPEMPIPSKLNIPDWLKQLSHTPSQRTIKGCIPFLDTLTIGYLLKLPQDFYLEHRLKDDTSYLTPSFVTNKDSQIHIQIKKLNLDHSTQSVSHPNVQLKNSPFINKNKATGFHKILNPFKIVTPPGYSCIFVPPLNNTDDRFNIISGIVDTDLFDSYINFPIIINSDKYDRFESVLKKGTPYVQIIPFKRDSWKMKIKELNKEKQSAFELSYATNMVYAYKNKIWNKKKYK
jgi:hypothetical protein